MRIALKYFRILLVAGLVSFGAVAAYADDIVDRLTAEMAAQGFGKIKVDRTVFGRTRVRGFNPTEVRIVEVNRKTGRIFKDKSVTLDPNRPPGRSPMEGPDFDDVNGGMSH